MPTLNWTGKDAVVAHHQPYNTGVDDRDESGSRTGWIYSDNVNSPEIAAWLGKVVGAEAEDLSQRETKRKG